MTVLIYRFPYPYSQLFILILTVLYTLWLYQTQLQTQRHEGKNILLPCLMLSIYVNALIITTQSNIRLHFYTVTVIIPLQSSALFTKTQKNLVKSKKEEFHIQGKQLGNHHILPEWLICQTLNKMGTFNSQTAAFPQQISMLIEALSKLFISIGHPQEKVLCYLYRRSWDRHTLQLINSTLSLFA